MADFVTPSPASPGDDVAVIAPSSGGAASARHVLDLALERLRGLELRPRVHPTARQSDGYLRNHPEARAAAIHEAFRDPDVSAVFATIGGDDQLRVLPHLDPTVFRRHPTRFFGMSDNTNLSLALWNAGVVSYYGGQLLNQVATPGYLHPYTERYLERALFEESFGELTPAEEWADLTTGWHREDYAEADPGYEPSPGWTWAGSDGSVTGRVWGGCLAIVEWHLMTGRYLPPEDDLDGTVLLVETAEDLPSPERVKWTFMCMGERGLLKRFDAVLVGRPATQNWRESRTRDEREAYRREQRESIESQVTRYNPDAPVVFDLDVGHTNPTAPLPVGGTVRVDPTEGTITFR